MVCNFRNLGICLYFSKMPSSVRVALEEKCVGISCLLCRFQLLSSASICGQRAALFFGNCLVGLVSSSFLL